MLGRKWVNTYGWDFQLNGGPLSPTAVPRGVVKRGASERLDSMRRTRSQGTRARLVRALTTAGTPSPSHLSLSTTPDDITPWSPPRSPGGMRCSPPQTGGWLASGGSPSVLEQRTCSLTHLKHHTCGSNVTYEISC